MKKYLLFVVLATIILSPLVVTPDIASAANSDTDTFGANCSITYYYADSNGKYIGDGKTLAPKTPYQLKARYKKGTCGILDSIQIGYIAVENGKNIRKFQACRNAANFDTEGEFTIIYSNYGDSGEEGAKLKNYAYIDTSTACPSSNPIDREYIRTTADLEISTSVTAKTAGNTGTGTGTGGTTTTPQGPQGLPNEQIDSEVKIIGGQNYDLSLGELFNPFSEKLTVAGVIVRVINILLVFSGMIAVIYIIIGGFQMVTAGGNESTVTKGKQTLTYAVAGLIVSILSFSIVAIIQSIIS